ncbi:Smr/MutS family protein [Parvibium lacunae]|nr:Smr/MutS family protein [Parvibium lacunae]
MASRGRKEPGWAQLAALRTALSDEAARRVKAAAEAAAAQAQKEAEQGLFLAAVKDAQPLKTAPRHASPPPYPAPVAHQRQQTEREILKATLSDELDSSSLLETDENLSFHQPHVGQDVVRKLRRGQWVIQAQLDLHGLRTDQARDALAAFIRDCRRREKRCLRIIHGKGHGSINKEPVLKRKVISWLRQKTEVLAFCQARPADGGAGAVIVLLSLD